MVLLPDGIRFSPGTTRRDWSDEAMARIREFYRPFTDPRGSNKVNLQGIVFDTNTGGLLPLEKYLAATVAEREPLASGEKTVEAVAREHGLNAKYLGTLWTRLTADDPSLLLDAVRARWRTAQPADVAALAADVAAWQKGLWKFGSVGHIGKLRGPKAWMEPIDPIVASQDLRFKFPPPARWRLRHAVAGRRRRRRWPGARLCHPPPTAASGSRAARPALARCPPREPRLRPPAQAITGKRRQIPGGRR